MLVQRENEGEVKSPKENSALWAGIFKAWGSIVRLSFGRREAAHECHRFDESIRVSLGWLRPRSASFRFA